MRWVLPTRKATVQRHAESVLRSLTEAKACVPMLWHVEAVSVLVAEERRGSIGAAQILAFFDNVADLDIDTDTRAAGVSDRLIMLAREHKLSGYDAAYLELALRLGLPLATADADLGKAAVKAGVKLYPGGAKAQRGAVAPAASKKAERTLQGLRSAFFHFRVTHGSLAPRRKRHFL